MFSLMYEAKGVGLAANQVGLPLRFFIVNTESNPNSGKEQVFINPVVRSPKGVSLHEEGCLSFPGLYGEVERPEGIYLQAYNLQGEIFSKSIDKFLARVVQHELDHLDGKLFIDHVDDETLEKIQGGIDTLQKVANENPAKEREEEIETFRQQVIQHYC